MPLPLLRDPLKAVLFRAQHRSSREADYILGGFAVAESPYLGEDLLQQFAFLLTHDDPEIMIWLQHPDQAPAPLEPLLLERINAFARTLKDIW
jgi:antitoxin CptB